MPIFFCTLRYSVNTTALGFKSSRHMSPPWNTKYTLFRNIRCTNFERRRNRIFGGEKFLSTSPNALFSEIRFCLFRTNIAFDSNIAARICGTTRIRILEPTCQTPFLFFCHSWLLSVVRSWIGIFTSELRKFGQVTSRKINSYQRQFIVMELFPEDRANLFFFWNYLNKTSSEKLIQMNITKIIQRVNKQKCNLIVGQTNV